MYILIVVFLLDREEDSIVPWNEACARKSTLKIGLWTQKNVSSSKHSFFKGEMAVNFKSDYLVRGRGETKKAGLEVIELVTSSPSQEYRQQWNVNTIIYKAFVVIAMIGTHGIWTTPLETFANRLLIGLGFVWPWCLENF